MVTWYGFIPLGVAQHIEVGDHWLTPEDGWKRWNGLEWKEFKDE